MVIQEVQIPSYSRNKDAQNAEAVGQVGNINYGGLLVPCQWEF